jgi:hypothetical protein
MGLRQRPARVRLQPQLEGLVRLFQVARYLPIVSKVDEEPFAIAHAIPQLPRSRGVLRRQHRLSATAVGKPQTGVGDGELGIDFDSALVERYGRGGPRGDVHLHAGAVGLQGFE